MVIASNLRQDFESIGARQPQIEQHDIRPAHMRHRLGTIAGGNNLIPESSQQLLQTPPYRSVVIDDKYTRQEGRIFLSGVQALVRLPLMQALRDKGQGLNTGGFVSGYRGSPLGGLDQALWGARKHLKSQAIEFTPPVDVIETTGSVEIIADLPGVAPDTLRVVFGGGTLVISGSKTPKACREHEVTFHLAERSFGTFARAVRLSGAFDAGRTTATLRAGELRVVLLRIAERRGRDLRIDVTIE